ncbi:hypothetical protein DERF_009400 [Dermatophagoides farinae]|uniref:Uncharacterized protein n=1 Tax=Dermatophagoides farinae TaxID=6954 RepID=A0A922L5N3_DERFA|nr:hypothetical protein DERF_009400 [Dermatophagoides farinae]
MASKKGVLAVGGIVTAVAAYYYLKPSRYKITRVIQHVHTKVLWQPIPILIHRLICFALFKASCFMLMLCSLTNGRCSKRRGSIDLSELPIGRSIPLFL